MEDKRVKKTKKYLKDALISLLDEEPFEQITVTQICNKSDISRITFYTHYADKYDLVEDIFQDMIQIGTDDYDKREKNQNQKQDIATGFINVMDSIVSLYYGHYDFFRHATPERNPYLAFSFYNHVLATVEHHTNKESMIHHMKYTTGQITGFLCYGLVGFLNESHRETEDVDKIEGEAHQLLLDIMQNGILF